MRHRPIGIGVQGLADAFIKMRFPFESEEAQQLNKDIFETIYYSALKMSCQLAREQGYYETYPGCPVSKNVSSSFTISNLSYFRPTKYVSIPWFRFYNMTCGTCLTRHVTTGRNCALTSLSKFRFCLYFDKKQAHVTSGLFIPGMAMKNGNFN